MVSLLRDSVLDMSKYTADIALGTVKIASFAECQKRCWPYMPSRTKVKLSLKEEMEERGWVIIKKRRRECQGASSALVNSTANSICKSNGM